MLNVLIGLGVVLLIANINSFRLLKSGLGEGGGAEDRIGWIFSNLIICMVGGFSLVLCLSLIDDTIIFGDALAVFLLGGGISWLANLIVMAIIVNCCLQDYVKYKQDCLRLGLDTKDYVNKFFVLTNQTDFGVEKKDGLRYDRRVNLYKIMYGKCFLGEYPQMEHVTTLVHLPSTKLQKEVISEYVQEYFSARGQYLVEGDSLKVVDEDRELDVIIIK